MYSNNIVNFFYEKASDRIKKRIKSSGLKYYEIHKPDTKQISRIVNKRITKNNPYLINDSVISSSYRDEASDKRIPCGLLETSKLGFKSKSDILWGTEEEIMLYIKDLFLLLWSDVSDNYSTYNIDKEIYLCDYIPYAKYSSYWNILFSPENKYPAITYGILEDTVIENIDSARDEAILFLFHKCHLDFEEQFLQFTKKVESFHKIDKVFQESFIEKVFVPMIKKYAPDNTSLGLRVRDLINADLSHCASLVFNPNIDNNEYKKSLISASSKYILALEDIQKSMS